VEQSLLSNIPYACFANYSPRGQSNLSITSRRVCGAVKAGRIEILDKVVSDMANADFDHLRPFFEDDTTLVPVPRSAPVPANALWPAKVICERFRHGGFAREISSCVVRTRAIPKSSSAAGAANRPSVQDQYDSLAVVQPDLFVPARITLVDDVLTLGRTSFACAMRLHEAFPDAEIRLFAVIRTKGFEPELSKFVDPEIGQISFNPNSGKTSRNP
jgi:hypothetical protein